MKRHGQDRIPCTIHHTFSPSPASYLLGNQPPLTPDALRGLMVGSLAEEKAGDVLVPNQVSSGSLLGAMVCHLNLTPATESADSSQLSPCSQQPSLAGETCFVQG